MPGDVDRLPVPDWIRPGEKWRVERESPPKSHWTLAVGDDLCTHHGRGVWCDRPAVATLVRNGDDVMALCNAHLRAGLMWVEAGHVVSWALRR